MSYDYAAEIHDAQAHADTNGPDLDARKRAAEPKPADILHLRAMGRDVSLCGTGGAFTYVLRSATCRACLDTPLEAT